MIFRNKMLAAFMLLGFFPLLANAETRNIVFPVDGETSFRDDFLEPRDGGAREHLGNDIIADKMTPLVAVVDGVISYIPRPEPSWGYMLTIQDNDGYQYRYLHLNNDTPGTDDGNGGDGNAYVSSLRRGTKVSAGQLIGWIGDSGNAEWTVSHLHFEIRNPSRSAINPYLSLIAAASPENFRGEAATVLHQSAGEAGVLEGAEFIFTIDLGEGMQGSAIYELQSRLKDDGYFTHGLTNYFGPITKAATQKFQRANNIAPTGVLGFQSRAILNNDPVSNSGKLRLEKELFEGMEGEVIKQVQLKLETLGHFNAEINGVFDGVLREAVRSYQIKNSLPPTGYVSYSTWNSLNTSYRTAPKPTTTQVNTGIAGAYTFTKPLSIGSRGEEVKMLQGVLQDLGHFSLNVSRTGYFGPITHRAVAEFQTSKGIESIGIVGPKTRGALNAI